MNIPRASRLALTAMKEQCASVWAIRTPSREMTHPSWAALAFRDADGDIGFVTRDDIARCFVSSFDESDFLEGLKILLLERAKLT